MADRRKEADKFVKKTNKQASKDSKRSVAEKARQFKEENSPQRGGEDF